MASATAAVLLPSGPQKLDVSASTFERLSRFAVPFIDTPETVINRALDALERETKAGGLTAAAIAATPSAMKSRPYLPDAPPSLTHAKPLEFIVDGKSLPPAARTWNGFLLAALRVGKAKTKTQKEFESLVAVNFVSGHKDGQGYKFQNDLGISVQGQDAVGAWRGAHHIAKALNFPVVAKWVWRDDKEDAFKPGMIGELLGGYSVE